MTCCPDMTLLVARAHKLVDDAFVIIEGNASRFSTGALVLGIASRCTQDVYDSVRQEEKTLPRSSWFFSLRLLLPLGFKVKLVVYWAGTVKLKDVVRQDVGGHDEQAERSLQLYDRLACEENQLLGKTGRVVELRLVPTQLLLRLEGILTLSAQHVRGCKFPTSKQGTLYGRCSSAAFVKHALACDMG